jgi:hypothetical protein
MPCLSSDTPSARDGSNPEIQVNLRRIALCVPLLVTLPAMACTQTEDIASNTPSWTATTDTVADTVIVRTVSGQVWDFDKTLVSEVGIGVLEGQDEYQFGQVLAIAVDDEGRMYAFDSHVPVLRVYAPDGTWLRDIGREGEGPGEYKQPDSGLAVMPDGRIAIRDPGNGRILLFAPEGTYDDYYRIAGSFSTGNPLVADTAGVLVTYIITNLGAPVMEWKRGMARYHSDGAVDTLQSPDLGFETPVVSGQREGNSSSNYVPYSPKQETAFSRFGYYIVGISDDYSFDLLRPEGVLRVVRASERVPVDPAEAAIEREQLTERFKRQFPGWKWNGPPIPDVKPAYHGLFPAEDGRVWVRVPAPSERYLDPEEQRAEEERLERPMNPFREPTLFDVFEPTGEYLGRVSTPVGFSLYPRPVFRGETVWAIVRDEYDVQRLHRFRLENRLEPEVQ